MISPKHEHHRLQTKIQKTQAHLERFRNIRLGLGLSLFVMMIVIAANDPSAALSGVFFGLAAIFTYFLFGSRKIQNFLSRLESLSEFSKRQMQRLTGSYHNERAFQVNHAPQDQQVMCQDLHLLGNHSLFTLLDETLTDGGRGTLAQWIYSPLNSAEEINTRQREIQELAPSLQKLKKLITLKEPDFQIAAKTLEAELKVDLVDKGFRMHFYIHMVALPIAWISFILLLFQKLQGPLWLPFLIYFFYFVLSRKQILHNFHKAEEYSYQLKRLYGILDFLEKNFDTPLIGKKLKHLKESRPSLQMKSIEKITSALSVQGHPMAYLFFNVILPWDFWWTARLVSWRDHFIKTYPLWTQELYEFEALMSLAIFNSYQTQTWPQLIPAPNDNTNSSGGTIEFEVKDILHPLIDREEAISNNYSLNNSKSLVLITGSNMSGKSTFLRTLGINHTLALMGAPVFATSYKASYMRIFSCLQVTDSLDGGISTFYYEVKAIKELLERARAGEPIIYFVDEIFRGTNNRERFLGSQAVIKELVQYPSVLGFISTHDLDLAKMEAELPALTNWHFKDDVNANRLSFSYKIQSGPCPSTNALKIMRSEGLPVDSTTE